MRTDPRSRYLQHKRGAADRGIEFLLSFEQWWELWEPHWEKRGTRKGQMCMCRRHDTGPYAVGNVRIATNRENHQERAMMNKIRRAPKQFRTRREYRTPLTPDQAAWARGRYDETSELDR